MGKFTAAQREYEAAIAIMSEYLGPRHPDVGRARGNLGTALAEMGNFAEAKRERQAAVSILNRAWDNSN
jgi:Flp pilus assembly protein TadD